MKSNLTNFFEIDKNLKYEMYTQENLLSIKYFSTKFVSTHHNTNKPSPLSTIWFFKGGKTQTLGSKFLKLY